MKALALVVLLTGCSAAYSPDPAPPPAHAIKVVSVSCAPNAGRPRADITVQNVGSTTIEWAKAVVAFGPAMSDTYVSPRPLRPGAIGSITTYAPNKGDSVECSLVQIADGDGFVASLIR